MYDRAMKSSSDYLITGTTHAYHIEQLGRNRDVIYVAEPSKEEKTVHNEIIRQYLCHEFTRKDLLNFDIESLMPELSAWEIMIAGILG